MLSRSWWFYSWWFFLWSWFNWFLWWKLTYQFYWSWNPLSHSETQWAYNTPHCFVPLVHWIVVFCLCYSFYAEYSISLDHGNYWNGNFLLFCVYLNLSGYIHSLNVVARNSWLWGTGYIVAQGNSWFRCIVDDVWWRNIEFIVTKSRLLAFLEADKSCLMWYLPT